MILTHYERNLLHLEKDVYLKPNSWKLLYRASRDGDRGKHFHDKCDGICPVLVIIKSKEHGHVFGGFTHLPFMINPSVRGVFDNEYRNWLFLARFASICVFFG